MQYNNFMFIYKKNIKNCPIEKMLYKYSTLLTVDAVVVQTANLLRVESNQSMLSIFAENQ